MLPCVRPMCVLCAALTPCSLAAGLGDILCDDPTHAYAKYKANYEELEPIPLKGKKMPVCALTLAFTLVASTAVV